MTGARSNITSGAGLIRVVTGLSGQAPAGNATINTRSLTVRDRAQIFTATGGASSGGYLTINASEKVQVSRVSADGKLISGILGDARGSGNAGSVRINTNKLVVSDFGRIGVDSTGTGNAGNLEIFVDSVRLNNAGNINAATSSGSGGNIILQARELQGSNNSSITATAGNNGNGGNITINVGTIALLNNSDITANAFLGRGGNINISTQGLFRSADSDITASSLLGINGIVNVTTPDIKQDNSFKQQASNFINAEQVVANSCLASRNNQSGKFVITGNSGVAETPSNTNIAYEVVQIQPVAISTNTYKQENITSPRAWKLGDSIIEAKELRFTPSGRIVLSATTNKDNLLNTQSLTC